VRKRSRTESEETLVVKRIMSVKCRFIVHGDPECVETGTVAEVETMNPMSLKTLHEIVPFEGRFHFRIRANMEGKDVWVDVTDNSILSYFARERTELVFQVTGMLILGEINFCCLFIHIKINII
jgi:hypothetical protein